jgi:hypothetical protein
MENGDSHITFDRVIKTITALLTAILAGVGIWYAIETRNLRIAAETEIEEYKKQFHLSVMPDLYPAVISPSKVAELVMEGKIFQASGEVRYTKEQFAKLLKYYVTIENIGRQAAYDTFVYIYTADTKSYMKAPTYKVFVRPGKVETISFFDTSTNYKNEKEIIEDVKKNFEIEIKITNYIKSPENNCLFLFYKDIQNNVYLRVRQFAIDKHKSVIHGGTQFYQIK